MPRDIRRRDFLKLGLLSAELLGVAGCETGGRALRGRLRLAEAGEDYSPIDGERRQAVPSACWQCVARDSIICYVEDGRAVKIEGNPRARRNRGKICAKGQAGINQLYDPDRILYPMERAGARGEGRWKRISWDAALERLARRLQRLIDDGRPEKFVFHYGRLKGSDSAIVKCFMAAIGSGSIGNHTAICECAKWTAQELTWGHHYDTNDVEHTNMILNFGCNLFETHTSHIQLAQRTIAALVDRHVPIYTFDVRLSNTAAKSTEWIPIHPGTDLAVVLAMCRVIMKEGLYDRSFIEKWTNVTPDELEAHLAEKGYTPEWAEAVSGVPASTIRRLARAYAAARPGTIVSYRGAIAHYNGVVAERAMKMLDAICGYVNVKGGTCQSVAAHWEYPKPPRVPKARKLKLFDGRGVAYPNHHVSHMVLRMIEEAPPEDRPAIYSIHCYEPIFANGDMEANRRVLADEKLLPFIVAATPFYSESVAYADLILPDVTYLERWSWDDMVCYDLVPEYYIRQPAVAPMGEARQFQDVCCDLAGRLRDPAGRPLDLGFSSTVDFIRKSCERTAKKLGEEIDFDRLVREGVWVPRNAAPHYDVHAQPVAVKEEGTVILDEETGVYWDWTKSAASSEEEARKKGYAGTKNAYKGYVAQRFPHGTFRGFPPDKVNKSGKFEIRSRLLEEKGFPGIPSWIPIPEHEGLGADELILTTFKVNVQTHSRTQNCMWLTEIFHKNPAWIHPGTAERLGIREGGRVRITYVDKPYPGRLYRPPARGYVDVPVHVTECVHPKVVAISHHLGHWEYGEFASGRREPWHACVPDCRTRWWRTKGVRPNWIMPNAPDPIAGQLRFMDTVVKVEPVRPA